MVSYAFVGYDDYSVLQLCIDGPGEPGWFRWLKALMLELPFLLLPVFYILPIISSGFMCFLSGEPFMDAELFRY